MESAWIAVLIDIALMSNPLCAKLSRRAPDAATTIILFQGAGCLGSPAAVKNYAYRFGMHHFPIMWSAVFDLRIL
jgi:hypothetical protein